MNLCHTDLQDATDIPVRGAVAAKDDPPTFVVRDVSRNWEVEQRKYVDARRNRFENERLVIDVEHGGRVPQEHDAGSRVQVFALGQLSLVARGVLAAVQQPAGPHALVGTVKQ